SISLRSVPDGGLASIAAGLAPGVELAADAGKWFHDRSVTYGATLKLALLRHPRWQVAVVGSYRHVEKDCGDCVVDRSVILGGAIATGCLDDACRTLASIGGGLVLPKMGDNVSAAAS